MWGPRAARIAERAVDDVVRRLRREIGNHIAQAVTLGEMCRRQRNELREPRHPPQRRAVMMGCRERIENMSRDQP